MRFEELSSIYVCCTGNTCRSPMAERILIDRCAQKGLSIDIASRRAAIAYSSATYNAAMYNPSSTSKDAIGAGTSRTSASSTASNARGELAQFPRHPARDAPTDTDEREPNTRAIRAEIVWDETARTAIDAKTTGSSARTSRTPDTSVDSDDDDVDIEDIHDLLTPKPYTTFDAGTPRQPSTADKYNPTKTHSPSTYSSRSYSSGGITREAEDIIIEAFNDKEFVNKHRAKDITAQELESADLIITMDQKQRERLCERKEAYTKDKRLKVYTFGQLVGEPNLEIEDPMMAGSYTNTNHDWSSARQDRGATIPTPAQTPARSTKTWAQERDEHYKSTFRQLENLIDRVIAEGELRVTTLEEGFVAKLQDRYDMWTKRSAESTDARKPKTWSRNAESPAQKNYNALTSQTSSMLKDLDCIVSAIDDTFDAVSVQGTAPEALRAIDAFANYLTDDITPKLIRHKYITKKDAFDNRAFTKDIASRAIDASRNLATLIRATDRDGALCAMEAAEALFTFTTEELPTATDAMFNELKKTLQQD
ncbi:TPA: hypothetical protein HA251_08345 [Candidatus Woesearchaeota archaeon]|nr:hypothetical protein [Candidatus Woesearchaeota archaeon]